MEKQPVTRGGGGGCWEFFVMKCPGRVSLKEHERKDIAYMIARQLGKRDPSREQGRELSCVIFIFYFLSILV